MRVLRPSLVAATLAVVFHASSAAAATIDVTTLSDVIDGADGLCSLREAVTAANSDSAFSGCTAGSGADTITLHAGTYALSLPGEEDGNGGGDLDIVTSITFTGAGAKATTINGGGIDRVFDFQSPGGLIDCAIDGVTITGGVTGGGGGAIRANVPSVDYITVIVRDSALTGNNAEFGGATIVSPGAVIQLERCLVAHNTANYIGGASYGTYGTTRFINSTVAQNSAPFAGAIMVSNSRVEISGSTITDNTATNPGFNPNDGNAGGILINVQFQWGGYRALFITNSIVSGNHWPSDPYDADIACNRLSGDAHVVSSGYNLVGSPGTQFFGCRNFAGQQGGYWIGTDHDQWGAAPALGPLADNGGPTQTYALLPGVGVGDGTCAALGGVTLTVDQRSSVRPAPSSSSCDRGAYERGVCGDGTLETPERCDNGSSNSDSLPDACRKSCEPASCGDGVKDTGEACDQGVSNSNTTPDACRATCVLPSCGDGVTDTGEGCDTGNARSDTIPNACRTTCALASCGDGVTDTGEGCDTGNARSDTTPNACRTSCALPSCGDGVTDSGEACDTGNARSDTTPNACRTACVLPVCGDGVQDSGEACDTGVARSDTTPDACRISCALPSCGDNVQDSGEECDLGSQNGGASCTKTCTQVVVGPDAGSDAGADAGSDAAIDAALDGQPDSGNDAGATDGAVGDGQPGDGALDAAADGNTNDGAVDAGSDGSVSDGAIDALADGAIDAAADGNVNDAALDAPADGALADAAPQEDGAAGDAAVTPGTGSSGDDSGCGCRVAGTGTGAQGALALLALAGVFSRRRARRARRNPGG